MSTTFVHIDAALRKQVGLSLLVSSDLLLNTFILKIEHIVWLCMNGVLTAGHFKYTVLHKQRANL